MYSTASSDIEISHLLDSRTSSDHNSLFKIFFTPNIDAYCRYFYYTSNQNAILSAHTKNEIFRIKIEKVKNLFYPKSFNSPYPGGLRVEIFLPAKFP